MTKLLRPRVFLQISQKPQAEDLAMKKVLSQDTLQGIDINSYEILKSIEAKISDGDLVHLLGHEEQNDG